MNHIDQQPAHRLFAAIVLMGSGLAGGCGGISEREGPPSPAGHPSAATGGSSSSSGGSPSVGGATSTAGASENSPYIELGGALSRPEPIEPGPFMCPPQQWTCVSEGCDDSGSGWKLPEGCGCDPKKPLDASECQEHEVFVCLGATSAADGRPFTEPVPLSCTCVPQATYSCRGACELAYGQPDLSCFAGVEQISATCGCAVVFLK